MNTRYFLWVFTILLISCVSTSNRPDSSLLRADSLIYAGRADSALKLLNSVNSSNFTTELSKAWYALLLTQTKDKNYIVHTNDSLIRIAVDFFDTSNDKLQRAKAHYYWGRVFQDRGDVENTVREFLTAMTLVEQTEDYELSVLLKSNLGLLFWENGLQEEADSLYQKTIELAEAHQDTLRMVSALINRADICIEKGESYYADADKKISRALDLIDKIDNRHIKAIVFSSLSYLRDYQKRPNEVILYAHKGLKYTSDNSAKKGYYFILGSAYAQLESYDSATIYLERSLETDNYYTKGNAYMRLSEIASVLGNKDKALKYETLYGIYKDSMKLVEQPVKVVSTLKNVLYIQSLNRYNLFLVQYRFYLLLTGGFLFVSICLYLYKRKERNEEIMVLKTKHQLLCTSIESLGTNLLRKESEIGNLQKHCEELEVGVSQKRQLESCLKELVEQYHQIQENLEKQLNERNREVARLRSLNLKSVMNSSLAYKELLELCEYNSQNPDKMKKMTSDEWDILLREINVISLGFVERLQNKYEYLLEDDIHFCCLVKLDFKYSNIAFIWGCSTIAIYKRSQSVLERMGIVDIKRNRLIDILNQI